MRRILFLAAILLGWKACFAANDTDPLPYLQNPSADGMTVCVLAKDVHKVRIHWGRDNQAQVAHADLKESAIPGAAWTIWKVRLNNLHPGAGYHYEITSVSANKEQTLGRYHFSTLDPRADSVRFAAFNDIHQHSRTLAKLMQFVKPDDYEFSVLLGDCLEASRKDGEDLLAAWRNYIRLLDAADKPLIFVRGNHDVRGQFADRLAYLFDLPRLKTDAKFAGQDWYFTLRSGPACLLALDGGDDFTKRYELFQPIRQRQAAWLRETLKEDAISRAPWKILLTHMPLYNNNIWNSEPCREIWEPVLKNAGITLALGGHDHGWKLLPAGKTFTIRFNGHYPDQQDAHGRKTFSLTTLFPQLIGGGPSDKKDGEEATVMLFHANAQELRVRLLAVSDGRQLTEFRAHK